MAETPHNIVSMSELKKRRRAKRLRNGLVVGVVLVLVLAHFLGAYQSLADFAANTAENISIAFTPKEGWPAKTGMSDFLRAEPLAEGVLLLGKTDAMVYSAGGNKLRSLQHGYARPAISTGNSRFCIYNRAGYELQINTRTRTLYTFTTEQPILLAQMSAGGNLAVVTTATRAMADVKVYDSNMKFRFGWTATETEGMPSSIAFAADNKRFAVACMQVSGGALQSEIFLLDTRKDTVTTSIKAGANVMQMHWLSSQKLLVIYDTRAAVYDATTGQELAVYSYGGESLLSASVSGQNAALLLGSALPDSPAQLVVLNAGMQALGTAQVASPANGVVCGKTAAYILREKSVAVYSLSGEAETEIVLESVPNAVLNAKQPLVFSAGNLQLLQNAQIAEPQ